MVTTTNPGLSVELPTDREVRLTRSFDAPRELVFDAFTRPEHMVHWLTGPEGWTFEVCEVDLRPGGAFRYIWAGPAGKLGSRGEYRDIVRPAKVVAADIYDDFKELDGEVMPWPASVEGESVSSMTLEESEGRTTYTNTFVYRSREARDAALATGMDQGMAAGFDRLDGYLKTIG